MSDAASPCLELVILELEMLQYSPLHKSFSDHVYQAAEEIGGHVLFNTRLEDDDYQRCIGMIVASGDVDETTALLFLSRDGRSVQVEDACDSGHPIAGLALEAPSNIGLIWSHGAG